MAGLESEDRFSLKIARLEPRFADEAMALWQCQPQRLVKQRLGLQFRPCDRQGKKQQLEITLFKAAQQVFRPTLAQIERQLRVTFLQVWEDVRQEVGA